jgi:hypothetical protein
VVEPVASGLRSDLPMNRTILTVATLLSIALRTGSGHAADAPGLDFDIRIERAVPSDKVVVGERNARMRVAGTVLLTLGATMIPTTAAAWTFHAKGHDICFDGCSNSEAYDARAVDGAFGASLVLEHVMVGAGRYLVTAGYGPRGSERAGPRSEHGRGLRAAGITLVTLATIVLPVGVAFLGDESFAGPMTGIGAAMLATGVPIAAAGSYYDNTRDPINVGASPLVRKDGDPPGRTLTGMVTTLSGKF